MPRPRERFWRNRARRVAAYIDNYCFTVKKLSGADSTWQMLRELLQQFDPVPDNHDGQIDIESRSLAAARAVKYLRKHRQIAE